MSDPEHANIAKQEYKSLDKKEIFKEQSHLIDKIKKTLSKDVFSNFVSMRLDALTKAIEDK